VWKTASTLNCVKTMFDKVQTSFIRGGKRAATKKCRGGSAAEVAAMFPGPNASPGNRRLDQIPIDAFC